MIVNNRTDRGSALPLVLVITVVLSTVVISVAKYSTTSLVYATIAEDRSDRLAAADAGMRYAIDQLKLRNAACIIDEVEAELPRFTEDFNGASATVTCKRVSGGVESVQAWAAVMTGEGSGMSTRALLTSQGGNSEPKVLGGPVFMQRVTSQSFNLSPPVEIEDGPLYYYGGSCAPGTRVTKAQLPAMLTFKPDFIYGPECLKTGWTQIRMFRSPSVPTYMVDPSAFPERNGSLPTSAVVTPPAAGGSYDDSSGCRVFYPGRYTTPPVISGDAYFMTGDYLFDFDATFNIDHATVTAGIRNEDVGKPAELAMTPSCAGAQAADRAAIEASGTWQFGASFYFAKRAHLQITTQGSLEIHARQQGNAYVSIQTLCDPSVDPAVPYEDPNNLPDVPSPGWCTNGLGSGYRSTLTSPSTGSNPSIVYTASGNNRELVAHGYVYAPLAQMEFGNVTSTASQKLLGGVVVSRLVLQSSASASNFEIAVPTTPIHVVIALTSTATKNGQTSLRAVVEYRPYERDIDDRIAVNSWRVCDAVGCP